MGGRNAGTVEVVSRHVCTRRVFVGSVIAAAVLGSGCKPATEQDKYRRALGWTNVQDVRQHLDGGKDPTHVFPDGAQPIHVVAESIHGKGEILRLLIERGADVNAVDGDGQTAWDLRWGDGDKKLGADDAVVLLALLDGGFKPPTPTLEDGRTLLHAVARNLPSARLVAVLVTGHGYDANAVDDNGWTPLHVAVHENNDEAATGLLANGGEPNAETTKTVGLSSSRRGSVTWRWRYEAGSRPLDVYRSSARGRNDTDVRKVLEQYGATKNAAVHNKPR